MKKVFLLTISLIFISLSSCSNDEANEVSYRSWQGKYDSQMLTQNPNNSDGIPYANNFSSENSSIRYNLKLN